MASIYISYSQQDVGIVRKLAAHLRELKHDVFFGEDAASPGEDWNNALSERLLEADLALVIVSKASVASAYVLAEAGAAIAYSRNRDGALLVVPVVIDSTPVPGALHGVSAILAADGDVQHVVSGVQRALGAVLAKRDERKQVQQRISETASKYIRESLARLHARETKDRRIAYLWYTTGFATMVTAVTFAIWRMWTLNVDHLVSWTVLVELIGLGFVAVGVLIGLSKFAFTLGKSFMVEAIRNADRIHAISFGDFYLHAFGDKVNWSDLKDAFQHWNVDRGSAFSTQDAAQYDPKLGELVTELSKAVTTLRGDVAKR